MMNKELRVYQEKLIKEMQGLSFFSWKRLKKAIELAGICDMMNR